MIRETSGFTSAMGKGDAFKSIRIDLKANHPEWEPIETDNGVKKAGERYAKRHDLPEPAKRKAGRPNTN